MRYLFMLLSMVFVYSIVLIMMFSCSPVARRNAEISVSYENNIILEESPGWNIESEFAAAMNDGKSPDFIIFSAVWCSTCRLLKNTINKMGWREKVLLFNMRHQWVQGLAENVVIQGIPEMFVIYKDGAEKTERFLGASEIAMKLFDHFERNKKK